MVASTTIDGRGAVAVSSIALGWCRTPLVSEAESEEESSSDDLANGSRVSRGARTPILSDLGPRC